MKLSIEILKSISFSVKNVVLKLMDVSIVSSITDLNEQILLKVHRVSSITLRLLVDFRFQFDFPMLSMLML